MSPLQLLSLAVLAATLAAVVPGARPAAAPYDSAEGTSMRLAIQEAAHGVLPPPHRDRVLICLAESGAFWRQQGRDALARALDRVARAAEAAAAPRAARNVVVFIGDGMGVSTTTAARIYKGQKEGRVGPEGASLVWERFPSVGLFKVRTLRRLSRSFRQCFSELAPGPAGPVVVTVSFVLGRARAA